ncbi:MAG TPA: hypothetical protein VK668_03705 [Mucilaginibacter sp.]|nr:hypothetical protein [Mucilaginibacter sp.]
MSVTATETANNNIRLEWVPSAYRQTINENQPVKAIDSCSDKPLLYVKKSAHSGLNKYRMFKCQYLNNNNFQRPR